jgi:hypothetical protein
MIYELTPGSECTFGETDVLPRYASMADRDSIFETGNMELVNRHYPGKIFIGEAAHRITDIIVCGVTAVSPALARVFRQLADASCILKDVSVITPSEELQYYVPIVTKIIKPDLKNSKTKWGQIKGSTDPNDLWWHPSGLVAFRSEETRGFHIWNDSIGGLYCTETMKLALEAATKVLGFSFRPQI